MVVVSAANAVLTGTSPVTGRGERAEIVCRAFGTGQILYAILVSPAEAYATFPPGTIGGPVTITSDQPVLASQRVQFEQTFNEVWAIS